MIWFAITWLVLGSAAAVIFGLMAHQSQVSVGSPKAKLDALSDADGIAHKGHAPAH